jgi:hypothetical protein
MDVEVIGRAFKGSVDSGYAVPAQPVDATLTRSPICTYLNR